MIAHARHLLPVLAALALLAGCGPHLNRGDFSASPPEDPPDVGQPNGAIFREGHDIALFENPIAHRVGDMVTIVLQESTSATKSAVTTTQKTTTASLAAPTVVGNAAAKLAGNVNNANKFDGEGTSAQSNNLTGNITVTVAKRLSNGNLLVRGEKWLSLNQGREFIRVQGIVRVIDIASDNSVPSWKVADAKISYGGKGAIADANGEGLLARFFNSPLMPW